jgi:hypothetical protein
VERVVDPGYLAVSDSEVAGYTGKKQPAGWWSILVIEERGAGEGNTVSSWTIVSSFATPPYAPLRAVTWIASSWRPLRLNSIRTT